MNMRVRTLSAALACTQAALALAGPLAPPPGAVGSTGRTLAEIEPRIPISLANTPGDATTLYKISLPGHYYLTGDLVGVAGKRGIRVDADDVTIDLGGFTLRGPGSGTAIADRESEEVPSIKNLTLRNGTIEGWGDGLNMFNCSSARVEDVTFTGNLSSGLSFNGTLLVRSCAAYGNGGTGFENQGSGQFIDCISSYNAGGFFVSSGQMENCSARSNQYGITLNQSTARNCVAQSNATENIGVNSRSSVLECQTVGGGIGIRIYGHTTTVERCSVMSTSGHGISVEFNNARVIDNSIGYCGSSSASSAIQVATGVERAHIEGNSAWDCYRGIIVQGSQCMILRNRVGRLRGAYNTYFIAPGNVIAPIVQAATNVGTVSIVAGSPTYAGTVVTTDPNANISY